jgi:Ca2+-binding RTX toxin-like protein
LLVKFAVANGLLSDIAPGLTYDPATDLLTTNTDIDAQIFDYTLVDIAVSQGNEEEIARQWLMLTALVEIDPDTRADLSAAIGRFVSTFSDVESLLPAFENQVFEYLDININIGSSGADTIYGGGAGDFIVGFDGNDYLYGRNGDDSLYGSAGDDAITDYGGNDQIDGGSGDDRITVNGSGTNIVDGGAGSDAINLHYQPSNTVYGGAGDDTINAGSGNDVLVGGMGNDVLSGDAGNDIYLLGTGFGNDTISNYDSNSADLDVVRFQDASIEDLWFSQSGNNLEITVAGTDDRVTISNW